jgi:hypothetical protein
MRLPVLLQYEIDEFSPQALSNTARAFATLSHEGRAIAL